MFLFFFICTIGVLLNIYAISLFNRICYHFLTKYPPNTLEYAAIKGLIIHDDLPIGFVLIPYFLVLILIAEILTTSLSFLVKVYINKSHKDNENQTKPKENS